MSVTGNKIDSSRRWAAGALDLAVVVIFVTIGRAAHSHGLGLIGELSTLWPFASGLAIGWLILSLRKAEGFSLAGGIIPWLSTVIFGMVLRVLSGQGTAVPFILVAFGFLGLFMLGWRAIAALVSHLFHRRGEVPSTEVG